MKNTKKFFTAMLLVLVGLTTLSFMAKEGITLRLHPQQGKSYAVNSKATIMQMIEVQGQTINANQTMEINQGFTVKNVTDEQTDFESQIESMKLSISQGGMKMEYDSEHPEKTNPMLAAQTKEFDKVIKKPAILSYDALGNLITKEDEKEEEGAMNRLGSVIPKLPEEEVSVGSTWKDTSTQSVSDMEFTVEYTYTVTAISKKSVDVSFKGTILKNNDNITGTYTGTASINPNTGLIMKSTTKSNASMTMSQQGMTLPVTMVGNTTVTVTEK